MDAVNKLEYLISLLRDKKGLLCEMLELTKAQTNTIKEDSIDELNNLLNKKGVLISQIDKLDEAFHNTYTELKKELNVESLDLADILPKSLLIDMKNKTKEILDIMGEMKEIDEDNRKKAKELKDNFAAEIRKINISKQANNVYRGVTSYGGAHFIDSKK